MVGHAKECVERYCELANKTTQQLYKVSTPCLDDHHFKEEKLKSVRELSRVCSQIVQTTISFHHTCEYKQYCYVGNTAKQCRLGLFHDSDFAGDLEDSKSISGGTLCILGSIRLFQLFGCFRSKLQFHTVQQNQKSFLWMQG